MIMKCVARLLFIIVMAVILGGSLLHYMYIPVRQGTLKLERAHGTATLLREGSNGVHHIQADSLNMAVFT